MIDAFLGIEAPDPGWWAALCRVEAALALAEADVGVIGAADAAQIAAACNDLAAGPEPDVTGADSPVIPVVGALRARLRAAGHDAAATAAHHGATSQDVMDTALMLIVRAGVRAVTRSLTAAADAAATLARGHRDTPMLARTLLQPAEPTTFGLLAAGWGAGLDAARVTLDALTLPVQLGGAAGTNAALHPHGFDVTAAFAARLGLAVPAGVWHTERGVVAAVAGGLGRAAGAVAKPALDVVLLAQGELGEVTEGEPGGSSAMPHKRNPIAAVRARACAAEAPGLVATVLGAGAQELQRGAGTWHAEWAPLTRLLTTTAAAARALATSLGGLQVDAAAMRRHVDTSGVDVGHAPDLVDRYLAGRPA